jgi:ABC-type branched-subunit amino acid transport system ATPase component|tara:strand:+ start:995 stop:1108 length:114 start_codon:yes stop_codon:yes gene_type:complete
MFPLLAVEENLLAGLRVRKDGSKKTPERVCALFLTLK